MPAKPALLLDGESQVLFVRTGPGRIEVRVDGERAAEMNLDDSMMLAEFMVREQSRFYLAIEGRAAYVAAPTVAVRVLSNIAEALYGASKHLGGAEKGLYTVAADVLTVAARLVQLAAEKPDAQSIAEAARTLRGLAEALEARARSMEEREGGDER